MTTNDMAVNNINFKFYISESRTAVSDISVPL